VTTLSVSALTKSYGETHALSGLDLQARSGEVVGIAGPNGAGKSTLIRVLAGEEHADGGEILLDGVPWPLAARRREVAVVHQEAQVFPNLTVAENVMVERSTDRVRRPRLSAAEETVLAQLRLEPYAHRTLDTCSLVVKQLTEIARALLRDARLFLFDEPNSALTDEESEQLFHEIARLRSHGNHIVLFVSHRLNELVTHCDEVALVRDGSCADLLAGGRLTEDTLARELVVGHQSTRSAADNVAPRAIAGSGLEISGFTHPRGFFRDASLQLPDGTVTAVTGVEGSGGREFVRAVAGLEPARGVRRRFGGKPEGTSGTSYVPADRRIALFQNFSVAANVASRLGAPDIATRWGWLRVRRLGALAADKARRFEVKARSVKDPIASLSGGNQQKVAIAAAMASNPDVLAVEEPTRGVDVGTKAEIYGLLREYAAQGDIVLLFCTEAPEIMQVADRVCVMAGGRLSTPVDVKQTETVSELAAVLARLNAPAAREAQTPQRRRSSEAQLR
jgi:ABC-type sugar transport system ATPase subunit